MSSDRTPADVIADASLPFDDGDPSGYSIGRSAALAVLDALAAAGFRVVPEPDDTTRAEVEVLVERAKDRKTTYEVCKRYGISNDFDHIDLSRLERMADLLAAAYLSGDGGER